MEAALPLIAPPNNRDAHDWYNARLIPDVIPAEAGTHDTLQQGWIEEVRSWRLAWIRASAGMTD